MRAPTHLAFGLLCATGAFALGSRPLHQDLPALSCALLGSLLPDLDSPKSAPGRFLPFLSQPIERRWGHRTVTHSLLAFLGLALLLLPLGLYRGAWYAALLIGYLSHLVLDCTTKSGVPLFHPHPVQCVIPGNDRFRLQAGSMREWGLLGVLALLLVLMYPVAQAGGVWRMMRYLAATPPMAYRDYREATTQTRLRFKGYWRDTHQPVQGEALVLDGRIDRFLIAYEGQVLTYGEYGDILPDQARIHALAQPVQVDTLRVAGQPFAEVLAKIPEEAFLSGRLGSAIAFDPGFQGEWPHTQHQPLKVNGQNLELDFAPRALVAGLHPRRQQDPQHLATLQHQLAAQQRALLVLELRRPPVHYLELREAQRQLQDAQREVEELQDPTVLFSGVLYLRRGEQGRAMPRKRFPGRNAPTYGALRGLGRRVAWSGHDRPFPQQAAEARV